MRIGSVLLAGAILAAACAGSEETTAPSEAAQPAEPTSTPAAEPTATSEPAPTATSQPAPTATSEPAPTATSAPTREPPPAPSCQGVEPGDSSYTLDDGGGAVHDVRIFVPSVIGQNATTPVVLNWHGFGSNANEQVAFTAYQALAEAEGFIVVHPTGLPAPGSTSNSWELGVRFDDPGRDDLAFANALIDDVVARFCGDPSRIYSTGMSNGGFFTGRLVCELADRIAAAASIAGVGYPDDCSPARAVPFIAFHGTNDDVVAFDEIPDEFADFAAAMGCGAEPTEIAIGDDVIRYDYIGCDDDVPVSFFEVADGGHTWPGSPLAAVVEARLGHTTDTVNATELGWASFKEHSLGS